MTEDKDDQILALRYQLLKERAQNCIAFAKFNRFSGCLIILFGLGYFTSCLFNPHILWFLLFLGSFFVSLGSLILRDALDSLKGIRGILSNIEVYALVSGIDLEETPK